MQKFQLIIFHQIRILVSGVCFVISFPLLFICLTAIDSIGMKIIFIVLILFLLIGILFYYSVGYLNIVTNENKFSFSWNRKLFFNYREIEKISISEITAIVIDNNESLRKIMIGDKEVDLLTANLFKNDSQKFINYLIELSGDQNIPIIDSFDAWKKKGVLRIAYIINSIVLIISVLGIIIAGFFNTFSFKSFLFMPLVIFQLLFWQQLMKNKMK
jgi:hypothetical protein